MAVDDEEELQEAQDVRPEASSGGGREK